MKTSCFFTYKGNNGISIARYDPDCFLGGKRFPVLNPGVWFKSVPSDIYKRLYNNEVLSKLNPDDVWNILYKMVEPEEPVLLCWEKPRYNDKKFWCHRRLVANWLKITLGKIVEEL